jgi:hypothetical protein
MNDWTGLIDTRNGMAWIWMTDIWRFATLYEYDRWTKRFFEACERILIGFIS